MIPRVACGIKLPFNPNLVYILTLSFFKKNPTCPIEETASLTLRKVLQTSLSKRKKRLLLGNLENVQRGFRDPLSNLRAGSLLERGGVTDVSVEMSARAIKCQQGPSFVFGSACFLTGSGSQPGRKVDSLINALQYVH